jgi:WD40 repeat protein/DNA-binding CsgD family transcriptional regulator
MNQHADLIEPLTARELQILALIGEGQSYGEIGKELFIEKTTVTWYVQQIYDKLGLEKSQRNHQKALARAQAIGIIEAKDTSSNREQANLQIKNPYKGLRSFQQGDASEFFGREALIQRLLLRLGESGTMTHFLALVGPSGCGKSSVLHAGLIPALRKGGVQGSEQWIITSMVPGSHPLDELEASLARVSDKPGINIMAQLTRDERGLQRVCGMLLPENTELLLVVDQFEEIFSLVVDEKQRICFLKLISNSITQLHRRVWVMIALRADYYDRPLMTPVISELFRERTEVVTPLTADELAQAICMPAKQAGVQIESGLVEAMVEEVSERPGLLPLMQYSLTELFERHQNSIMTLADYYQIGGIRGALTQRAHVLYESLNGVQQALLRQIFLRLVRLGTDAEVLRRRVRRSELRDLVKDSQAVDELIDELAQYRLITLDYDPASDCGTVEIAHEALIREWEQLRDWLDDSRIDIRQQRLLAAAASDWREAKRDSSYLLSGTHLLQFQSWAQESQIELGPAEREFLTTSVNEKQHDDRQRRLIRNLVFSAVAIVAIVMSALAVIALDREQQAQEARIRADRRTLENSSIQLATYAQAAYIEGHTDLALLLAMKSVDMNDPPDLSEQIFRTITQGPGLRAILPTQINPITTLSISPNNKILLAGGCVTRESDLTCKQGSVIAIYIESDAPTLDKNPQLSYLDNKEFNGGINDIVFNPDDSSTALSACEDGIIALWDVSSISTAKVIRRYDGHAGAVNDVAFSPDGKQFISAYDQGTIILWDTGSGKEIHRLNSGTGDVTSVAFSRDSHMAISASDDGKTILWDVENKTETRRYASPAGVWLNQVIFGPADEYGVATVWGLSSNNAVYVWDLETAKQISEIPSGSNPYSDIAFTTGGDKVALAFEKMILLRNIVQGGYEQRLLQNSQAIDNSITALEISKDNTLLVSGDKEGDIELWNLPIRNDLDPEIVDKVTSLGNTALFPDQQHLLSSTGSADTTPPCLVKIDLQNNDVDECFTPLPNQVAPNGLAIDPTGQYVVVGGGNLEVTDPGTPEEPYLWVVDADSGDVLHQLEGHQHNIKALDISPDGRYALSGSAFRSTGSAVNGKGELILWDMQTGDGVRQFAYGNGIQGIAFSQDGKLAVTCSQMETNNYVLVWKIPTGEQVHKFSYGCIDAFFISNDESILINVNTETSMYQIVQIDANSGKIQLTFDGLNGTAVNFSISPDEQYLFAASLTSAALWNMNSSEALGKYSLPSPGANTWAVFPPESNNCIIVQDNSNQLIQWHINDLPSLANLRIWILKNRYLHQWTCSERKLYDIDPLCDQ